MKEKIKELIYCFFTKLPIKKNKIVFDNFLGKGYGDNPKYIAEEFIKRNLELDLVWLVNDKNEQLPPEIRKVRFASIEAMYEWATAKVWIDNVRNTYRPKKRRTQIYLQTWHGSIGFKKVEEESDFLSQEYKKAAKLDGKICDAIISSSMEQSIQFKNAFQLSENTEILEIGLPRNDGLLESVTGEYISRFRVAFNIPQDDIAVIYMPTFRDDNSKTGYITDFGDVISAFQKKFHKKTNIIVMCHPNDFPSNHPVEYNSQVFNGSKILDNADLYLGADFMITDYSNVCYDFSLLKKPVFLYAADYKEYDRTRGLRDNYLKMPFPVSFCEEELIGQILDFSYEVYENAYKKWEEKNMIFGGRNASEKSVDWILNKMNSANERSREN